MEPPPTHSLLGIEYFRVASLAFFIYEVCLTLDEEIELIWTKSNKNWFKWQYLFTRYFALLALIANRSIELSVTTRTELLPPPLRNWFSCQVVIGGALILSVEMGLMVRVYVLYNCSVPIACTFGLLLVCEIIAAIIGIVLRPPDTGLESFKVAVRSPDSFIYFGITAIISQIIILSLIIHKYKSIATAGWCKAPIVTRILKDGAVGFAVIFFVTTWTLLSAITDLSATISDSWFLAIVSCAGSRLVLNFLGCLSSLTGLSQQDISTRAPGLSTFADSLNGEVLVEPC